MPHNAIYIFATILAVLILMIFLSFRINLDPNQKKKLAEKPKEAWQHHEDSLEGRY